MNSTIENTKYEDDYFLDTYKKLAKTQRDLLRLTKTFKKIITTNSLKFVYIIKIPCEKSRSSVNDF